MFDPDSRSVRQLTDKVSDLYHSMNAVSAGLHELWLGYLAWLIASFGEKGAETALFQAVKLSLKIRSDGGISEGGDA